MANPLPDDAPNEKKSQIEIDFSDKLDVARKQAELPRLKGEGKYERFRSLLQEVPLEWESPAYESHAHCYFITPRQGIAQVDDFVEAVYYILIYYCLPRRRLVEAKNSALQGDLEAGERVYQAAKELLIRTRASQEKAGEPGELILFALLEGILNAPQIICKMSLKTNPNMPVHGSDGVHLLRSPTRSDKLRLVWGESKMVQKLPDALAAIGSSLREFLYGTDTSTGIRRRDLNVIRDHADLPEDPELLALLESSLDPYNVHKISDRFEESFGCLAAFDFTPCSLITDESGFRKQFVERAQTACELLAKRLDEAKTGTHPIYFFLIPFPSLEEFRRKFFARAGVPAPEA